MPQGPLRVGFLWHSLMSGNLGVDALTTSSIALAAEAARAVGREMQPTVLGMMDRFDGPPRHPGIRSVGIDTRTLLSHRGLYASFRDLDCIIDIGAGDSFTDIYGAKRFAFMFLSKALAVAAGRQLVLAPQTIGPFESAASRRLAGWALAKAHKVVVRDALSGALAGRIAPRAQVLQAVDVAFALPYTDRRAERNGGTRRVGVNVSGLLFEQARSGRNRFGLSYDYRALSERLIEWLIGRGDCEVLLFTHATSTSDPGDDDDHVCEELARQFPRATRVPNFTDASMAKSFVSSLDFVYAARMHACIAALSSRTPVVPISYSRKFAGLFGTLGYEHTLPTDGLTEDEALFRLRNALESAPTLSIHATAAAEKAQSLLDIYRAELARLFGSFGK